MEKHSSLYLYFLLKPIKLEKLFLTSRGQYNLTNPQGIIVIKQILLFKRHTNTAMKKYINPSAPFELHEYCDLLNNKIRFIT